jgi:hypothetical protein
MDDFELPKVGQARRLGPEDFRSEAFRQDAYGREHASKNNVNLQRLAEALDPRPIDEIAALMRALTYGDMIELAEGIWSAQVEGLDWSKDTLPSVLHRWSIARSN